MKLVTKHFPGEFGSEILVQKVKNQDEYNPVSIDGAHAQQELTMSRAERSLQQSISEQASTAQRRRTDKLKQEQKGRGPDKIRVTPVTADRPCSPLQAHTTFSELQRSVANQFGVAVAQQCIRYGLPSQELPPPKDGEENGRWRCSTATGVQLTLRPACAKSEDAATTGRMSSREPQDSIDLEMSSLCLLATLMGEDVWSYAKKLPHLFQQGGVFYSIVKKDMGLMDGKHCTLPHLTGKTFVYNAAEDRLELCVDAAGHFPVGPDVEELVKEALVQLRSETATRGSREGSPSHGVLRLGSGGVVRKKEQLQNVTAFQGKGHSLGSTGGSSPPEHRPITRQHSSGVDLSDGRGLDPGLMEQQRRKLQEMVSSIQASMERHLREQQDAAAGAAGGASQERTAGTKMPTAEAPPRPGNWRRRRRSRRRWRVRTPGRATPPSPWITPDAPERSPAPPAAAGVTWPRVGSDSFGLHRVSSSLLHEHRAAGKGWMDGVSL
uniref:Uncharacterized protein n=1 Tax=Sphaeramia orbicularis TaxID=375764 RepID=A0A673BDI1_9TELE